MACLTENQLLDHAAGRLDPAQARAADEHLDGCASCRAVLAALVDVEEPGDVTDASEEDEASGLGAREGTVLVDPGSLADDLPRGTALDRYVLLKRVGGGGMGVVYAAYDPRLDRTIAVKVLRSDVAATMTEEARARMLREAQAMARLSHPNVVTVHDAGTFQGRLYLAIEYLDEGTLADWLAREGRGWREVLEVFIQAGRGLAAAHAHGLVHRDFKPQNVMVAGDGRVRITDFGLVRPSGAPVRSNELTRPFLEMPLAERPGERLTRVGALLGTPRYMSPEQLAGKDVDARADQFSFCVALHEAVYGTLPLPPGSPEQMRRAIQEGRFNRPAPGRAAPEWLRRALVRGLSADPESRFASMDRLLDALLVGQEQARRRRALGVVASVVLVTVAGTSAVLVQRSRACVGGGPRPEAQVWTEERREAARQAFERSRSPLAAQAFQRASSGLEAYVQTWAAAEAEACAATRRRGEQPEPVMAARMACLDRRLLDVDALAQLLAVADAQVVQESTRAVSALRPPWTCLSAVHPAEGGAPSTPEAAQAQRGARRALAEARSLLASGKWAEAEGAATRSSEAAQLARDQATRAEAQGVIGAAQLRGGRWLDAETTLLQAEILAEGVHREDLAAELSTLLSRAFFRQARLKEAQLWADHGASALGRMPGRDDVVEAGLVEQQARLMSSEGRWRDAVAPLRKVVELKARALGPGHPEVAESMLSLARELKGGEMLEEALRTAQGARQILEKAYPADHPELVQAWVVLEQIHRDRGEYLEELDHARRVLSLRQRMGTAPGSLDLASAHFNAATALGNLGEHERALAETRAALAGYEAYFSDRKDRHAAIASLVLGVGYELYELGDDPGALAEFQRSLPIHERALGAEDPKMMHPLVAIGVALSGLGRAAEADRYFDRGIAAAKRQSEDADDLFYAYLAQGRALYERGRLGEARERLERALEIKKRTAPAGSTVLALVEVELARAELADGQVDPAMQRADATAETVARVLGPDQRLLALPFLVSGEARRRAGDAASALPLLEQAVSLCERYRYRPLLEAEARMALAAALRELRKDPGRAQALTVAAREQLARAGARPVSAPRPER